MNGIITLFSTLMTVLGDLPKAISALGALDQMILDVEATGQTGEQKLAAVLNDFEAFLTTEFPAFAAPFETIAAAVETAVNEIVALYNAFAKIVPAVTAAAKSL